MRISTTDVGKMMLPPAHRLPIPIPSFDIKMYWHARVECDPANQWLRNAVQELFGDQASHQR